MITYHACPWPPPRYYLPEWVEANVVCLREGRDCLHLDDADMHDASHSTRETSLNPGSSSTSPKQTTCIIVSRSPLWICGCHVLEMGPKVQTLTARKVSMPMEPRNRSRLSRGSLGAGDWPIETNLSGDSSTGYSTGDYLKGGCPRGGCPIRGYCIGDKRKSVCACWIVSCLLTFGQQSTLNCTT